MINNYFTELFTGLASFRDHFRHSISIKNTRHDVVTGNKKAEIIDLGFC
ncbi:hypothetical protein VVMO6_00132 [Vibrio vulnificus MO6-24/O]|nr:hypothetical protein VVMO6_00132 [Vibrio vulnificus MO6-24/O]